MRRAEPYRRVVLGAEGLLAAAVGAGGRGEGVEGPVDIQQEEGERRQARHPPACLPACLASSAAAGQNRSISQEPSSSVIFVCGSFSEAQR